MLNSPANTEFEAARRRAFLEEWFNYFTGRPNDLLSFEAVRQSLRLQDASYKGLQEIELDKIVGSVGRYRDFTRTFLPRNDRTKERWRRVDQITHDMAGHDPIEVFKIGEVYFVRDGNHRVSVARSHGTKTIEAYVIEYHTPVAIDNTDNLDDILLKAGDARFLQDTHIDKIRPDHNIMLTEPGRYRLLKKHILYHKFLKETDCGCEISYDEAVASWYDNVYMPVIEFIRQRDILKDFPGRTEADLFAWLVLHRADLAEQLEPAPSNSPKKLFDELEQERAANPFPWLVGLFRRGLNLESLSLQVEQANFLEETQLDQIRSGHNIEFTEAGCYELAQEHIAVHKYLKEKETSHELSAEQAIASWYDTVYQPIVALIEKCNLLSYFPGRTAGDLYIWFVSRRAVLEEERHALGRVSDEEVITDLAQGGLSTPMVLLARVLGQKLDLPPTGLTLSKV